MKQTKKDEFGNDIYWYVLGDEINEWVESLRDVFDPVPLEHFAASVKCDLDTQYDFARSQLDFVSEQLADVDVVTVLFEQYMDRLPKFSGKYIASCPELIWGAGNTEEECIADAKHWLEGNNGAPMSLSEAEIELHEATDRAYLAVKEYGADAERHIVKLFGGWTVKSKYFHVSELPGTVD
ncbi:hypothetical protein GTP46_11500 [Duganella sp. FT135W]|uniref:Uncharacterized protein n=1 Tax=Duganella flavida TaxID=2692175 RepID=A0A6L8KFN1_9BURK|nr:hypothetical protein [Duganella flavida]MYM23271.1 hypothetical protein [Duganella flavida]